MNILLASNNAHKYAEIRAILSDIGVQARLYRPRDVGFEFDCEETGATFAQNAWAKGYGLLRLTTGVCESGTTADRDPQEVERLVQERCGKPVFVLADDSGICVRALDNGPGVYSARFGNSPGQPPLTDEQRNHHLLAQMVGAVDRSAYYVCHAVLLCTHERYVSTQATWTGTIAETIVPGATGFGYDPIFYLPGFERTVSQLDPTQKNRLSHRAQAVRALVAAATVLTD